MRAVVKFFLFTFVLSWTLWIAAAYVSGTTSANPIGFSAGLGLLVLVGTIAPALVAITLSARLEGTAALGSLLRRIVPSQTVGMRWYVFAVSYFAVIKLGVALFYRLSAGAWPQFGQTPVYLMALAIIVSTPVQAGEEIGWRGYVLPRLASRLGLGGASLLLGVVWACWHLPFFFIPGADNYGQSFPVYLLAVTAISVAMAWLYWRTNGSLLLTMLFHAAINNTSIVSSPPSAGSNPFTLTPPLTAWLTATLLWIGAAFFLVKMRGARLSQDPG